MSSWADLNETSTIEDAKAAVLPASAAPPAAAAAAADDANSPEAEGAADTEAVLAAEKKNEEEEVEAAVEEKDESLHKGQIKVDGAIFESKVSFAELISNEKLLANIRAMDFTAPSHIQAAALPHILGGKNLIAQAHHGSGKTAAFSLGMISRVDPASRTVQAICLCNTRELALQVASVVHALVNEMGIRVYAAVRGVKIVDIDHHIVVGTPGTVFNRIQHGNINTNTVKVVAFDEADVLLADVDDSAAPSAAPARGGRGGARGGRGGRGGATSGSHMTMSLTRQAVDIRKKCKTAQVLLFSATFSPRVLTFAETVAPNAVKITVERTKLTLPTVKQFTIHCSSEADKLTRFLALFSTLAGYKQCMIFCNTVLGVKTLTNALRGAGQTVSCTYGRMTEAERDTAAKDFKTGKAKVLVSTNSLARGFDAPEVDLVINYDVPVVPRRNVADPDTYIHRINRAGRFGRRGVAVNFTQDPATRAILEAIEKEFAHKTTVVDRAETPQSWEVANDAISAAIMGEDMDDDLAAAIKKLEL